jgi:hypothetical protein
MSGIGFRYEFGEIIIKINGYLFGKTSQFYRRVVGGSPIGPADAMNRTATALNNH